MVVKASLHEQTRDHQMLSLLETPTDTRDAVSQETKTASSKSKSMAQVVVPR